MKTNTPKFTFLNTSKKSIAAVAIITSAFFTSCNSPAEDVSDAKQSVEEANQDLDEANDAYLDEVETYRKEAADKIELNNKSIAEFNERIATEKADVRADYKKKIAELDNKNTDLKKSIDDYQADSKEGWEVFKTKFSQDMDDLGAAFKAFFVPTVKETNSKKK